MHLASSGSRRHTCTPSLSRWRAMPCRIMGRSGSSSGALCALWPRSWATLRINCRLDASGRRRRRTDNSAMRAPSCSRARGGLIHCASRGGPIGVRLAYRQGLTAACDYIRDDRRMLRTRILHTPYKCTCTMRKPVRASTIAAKRRPSRWPSRCSWTTRVGERGWRQNRAAPVALPPS